MLDRRVLIKGTLGSIGAILFSRGTTEAADTTPEWVTENQKWLAEHYGKPVENIVFPELRVYDGGPLDEHYALFLGALQTGVIDKRYEYGDSFGSIIGVQPLAVTRDAQDYHVFVYPLFMDYYQKYLISDTLTLDSEYEPIYIPFSITSYEAYSIEISGGSCWEEISRRAIDAHQAAKKIYYAKYL